MITAVLIIIVAFGGFLIVVRRFLNGGTKPELANQIGDGSNQFDKAWVNPGQVGDASNQFDKDAGGQFDKAWKGPGPVGDAGDQFLKLDG